MKSVRDILELVTYIVNMLRRAGKRNFFLLAFLLIFGSSIASALVYTASGSDNSRGVTSLRQQVSQSEKITESVDNNSKSKHAHLSNTLHDPVTGALQIPYSGLVTRSLTPSLVERLGLDASTRGDVIVDIISGSPAERLGMRTLNLSRTGSVEETLASRGDIILAVDDSSAFTSKYASLEQYILENKKVGENIKVSLLRDGKVQDVEMTIAALPRFLWYEDRVEGIKMKYPSDWAIDEGQNANGEIVKFYSPQEKSLRGVSVANVSLIKYLPSGSDTSKASGSAVKDNIKIFRILDISISDLGNLPGYGSVYYDYSQSNNTRKVLTVFAEMDSLLYSLNFSADLTRYDDYLPLIEEMLRSFRFTR